MSFLRVGDTAAYDPRTLAPLERDDADERTVDEVFGFSTRLAAECGGKESEDTDRRATRGMVFSLAGSPARGLRLMEMLVEAKVWAPSGTGWELINDPTYLHLLTQEEVERRRIRANDMRDDNLVVIVRLRDGDHCRFCGDPVSWTDRRSGRAGTYEHVDINVQPTPPELYVVACKGCNSGHRDPSTLKPPPTTPKYGKATRAFITSKLGRFPNKQKIADILSGQRLSTENATTQQRPGAESAAPRLRTAPENALSGLRTDERNATAPTPHPPDSRPPDGEKRRSSAEVQVSTVTESDPSGRVGSGLDGSRRAVPGHVGMPPPTTRAKRSRRSKTQPQEHS